MYCPECNLDIKMEDQKMCPICNSMLIDPPGPGTATNENDPEDEKAINELIEDVIRNVEEAPEAGLESSGSDENLAEKTKAQASETADENSERDFEQSMADGISQQETEEAPRDNHVNAEAPLNQNEQDEKATVEEYFTESSDTMSDPEAEAERTDDALDKALDELETAVADEPPPESNRSFKVISTIVVIAALVIVAVGGGMLYLESKPKSSPVVQTTKTNHVQKEDKVLKKILRRENLAVTKKEPLSEKSAGLESKRTAVQKTASVKPGPAGMAKSDVPIKKSPKPVTEKSVKENSEQITEERTAVRKSDSVKPGPAGTAKAGVPTKKPPKPVVIKPVKEMAAVGKKSGIKLAAKKETYFTMQVATLLNKSLADAHVDRLKKKGYPVYIIHNTSSAGKLLTKLRIGKYKTEAEAKAAALSFRKKEKASCIIVKSKADISLKGTPAEPAKALSAPEVGPALKKKKFADRQASLEKAAEKRTKEPVKPVPVKKKISPSVTYSIQTGSYKNKKQADDETVRLQSWGVDAYSEKVDLKEKGVWYRVKVGKFGTFKEAKKFQSGLRQKDKKIKTIIVKR
jgi:cell division protein FtsN